MCCTPLAHPLDRNHMSTPKHPPIVIRSRIQIVRPPAPDTPTIKDPRLPRFTRKGTLTAPRATLTGRLSSDSQTYSNHHAPSGVAEFRIMVPGQS